MVFIIKKSKIDLQNLTNFHILVDKIREFDKMDLGGTNDE